MYIAIISRLVDCGEYGMRSQVETVHGPFQHSAIAEVWLEQEGFSTNSFGILLKGSKPCNWRSADGKWTLLPKDHDDYLNESAEFLGEVRPLIKPLKDH
jgi:hypothetical protein